MLVLDSFLRWLFTTLSVSGLSSVDDRVINEYGAVGGVCDAMILVGKLFVGETSFLD
jgi:hypothetical protein